MYSCRKKYISTGYNIENEFQVEYSNKIVKV